MGPILNVIRVLLLAQFSIFQGGNFKRSRSKVHYEENLCDFRGRKTNEESFSIERSERLYSMAYSIAVPKVFPILFTFKCLLISLVGFSSSCNDVSTCSFVRVFTNEGTHTRRQTQDHNATRATNLMSL